MSDTSTDDQGISPVVGVILMVAITVVLAGVLALAAFSMGDRLSSPAPTVATDVSHDNGYFVIETQAMHGNSDRVSVKVNGNTEKTWDKHSSAGDSTVLSCLKPGDTVQLVAETDGSEHLLKEYNIEERTGCDFVIEQGDEKHIVNPVNWEAENNNPAEFYSYGDDDGTGHPHAHMDDQFVKDDTSYIFFYEYNEQVSLVVVNDKPGEHGGHCDLDAVEGCTYDSEDTGGGAVDMTFNGLPDTGDWIVKDDGGDFNCGAYNDACWTWWEPHTDGGIYQGGLSGDLEGLDITVISDFNENASGYEHTSGDIESWAFVSGTQSSPVEIELDMGEDFTIRSAGIEEAG